MKLPGILRKWTSVSSVTIDDWRLGVTAWVLRIAVILYIVLSCIHARQYQWVEVPRGSPIFWFETGSLANLWTTSQPYCDNANYDYYYAADSGQQVTSYWNDVDVGCTVLQRGEMVKQSASQGFVTTFMKMMRASTFTCPSTTTSACAISSSMASFGNVVEDSSHGGYCTCGRLDNFFVLGVEDVEMHMIHEFSTSSKLDQTTGSSVHTSASDEKKKVRTCLMSQASSKKEECEIQYGLGDDTWSDCCSHIFEPGQTVFLTIAQWLDLAGISLDDYNELVEEDRVNGGQPYRRTSGVEIQVTLNYYGDISQDDWDCVIEVTPRDVWTSAGSDMIYTSFSGPGTSEFWDAWKRGIRFSFSTQGRASKLDGWTLLNTLIAGLVLFASINTIVGLISDYVLPEKKVYSAARLTQLEYGKALAHFGIQTALACQAFKSWDTGSAGTDATISKDELARLYAPYFGDDTAHQIAEVVMEQAHGKDGAHNLTCPQLVELMGGALLSIEHLKEFAEQNADHGKEIREPSGPGKVHPASEEEGIS
mmetsp:Transcript_12329/g.28919  ORF Transcript_12329/g.28919 Transcript_12329/m.28919 type:complete len:536 (-) Transcript_12329:174-1781(-)